MTFDRRIFNFAAGPATVPEEVLKQAAAEMLNWRGFGTSVMEISHRSKEFMAVYEEVLHDLRTLMNIPNSTKSCCYRAVALAKMRRSQWNFMGLAKNSPKASFLVTGIWSEKSFKEADKYGVANLVASSLTKKNSNTSPARSSWQLLQMMLPMFITVPMKPLAGWSFRMCLM